MTDVEERAGLLAECLEDINDSLIELTAVFRVKRNVLASADLQALDQLLVREESVAQALFNAETRREVLVAEMASSTGAKSERLVDLAERIPGGAGDVLRDTGSKLRDTVNVLVSEARIVAEICKAAMEHYDKLISIVTGAGLEGATYGAGGSANGSARRSIIDQAI